jgi:protein-S-isoprenylcysteine O-methyltransferase Ste14
MESASSAAGAASPALRLKNLGATAAIVAAATVVFAAAPYNRDMLGKLYGARAFSFTGDEYLRTAALVYVAILAAFFLTEANPGISKSLRFVRVLGRFASAPIRTWREGLVQDDRLAVLTTLLKAYFGPMMVVALMTFVMGAVGNGVAIAQNATAAVDLRSLFDAYGFWFLLQTIFFVDVLIFTVGYLVELPRLRNEIRSVDPTLLGWVAALSCYPPFNRVTIAILGSPFSEFPRLDNPITHFGLNALLLASMATYAWASVALGFKASNLTHRGIVARGPYAVVRHPAYVCKMLAWWIGSIPLTTLAFAHSTWEGVMAVASAASWALVYVLRAVTEEDHLRSVDGEYAQYAARVRYRFIPGVI